MVSCKKKSSVQKINLKKTVSVCHCLWPAVIETQSKPGNEFGSNRVLGARTTHLFQVIIVLWQNMGLLNIILLRFPVGENTYFGMNDTRS